MATFNQFNTKRLDPSEYSGLDIEGIISAPLIAGAHANSMMAKEQVQFLMDFCFAKNGDTYVPVMIRMSMTKGVLTPPENKNDKPTIERITTTFELPLLTIIPINSLAVKSMQLDFDLEVISQFSTDKTKNHNISQLGNPNQNQKGVKLVGRISSRNTVSADTSMKQHYMNKSTSSLKVNIKSGQLPLSIGLTSILNAYSKNIQPVELGNNETDDATANATPKT